MTEIQLMAAFDTVPLDAQDGVRQVIEDSIAELAREEGGFRRARVMFTESHEECLLTVELDGTGESPDPLRLDLEQLEDAVIDSGAQARVKEAMRGYFRRVLGR